MVPELPSSREIMLDCAALPSFLNMSQKHPEITTPTTPGLIPNPLNSWRASGPLLCGALNLSVARTASGNAKIQQKECNPMRPVDFVVCLEVD
ncbi:hypothetical protein FCOIX_4630 [Fusarium coicis]|nr:hypothetical protein FCOIX_4630 [Fusarium coicis]